MNLRGSIKTSVYEVSPTDNFWKKSRLSNCSINGFVPAVLKYTGIHIKIMSFRMTRRKYLHNMDFLVNVEVKITLDERLKIKIEWRIW